MTSILVVFPKRENAVNIRNILTRSGFDILAVCTSGAQVMQYVDAVDEGIVICGYKMQDMLYTELREYLPSSFEMLLIATGEKWSDSHLEGVVGLPMPIKVFDLVNTVDMMMRNAARKRKKRKEQSKTRTPEQQKILDEAKRLLMERNHMTEEDAHRYLQKNSMASGTNIVETARMVLSIMAE